MRSRAESLGHDTIPPKARAYDDVFRGPIVSLGYAPFRRRDETRTTIRLHSLAGSIAGDDCGVPARWHAEKIEDLEHLRGSLITEEHLP
jgi:hypothetical protein